MSDQLDCGVVCQNWTNHDISRYKWWMEISRELVIITLYFAEFFGRTKWTVSIVTSFG